MASAEQPEAVVRSTQTRRVLFIGFGGLLVLIAFTGLSAISVVTRIQNRNQSISEEFLNRQQILSQLRADIYMSGTYVRDFLMDPDPALADAHRNDFQRTKREIERLLAEYRKIVGKQEFNTFEQLKTEVSDYFASLQPALGWDAVARRQFGYAFMSKSLLPRRSMMLGLADHISRLAQNQMEIGNEHVRALFVEFRRSLLAVAAVMLLGGFALARVSFYRIVQLEKVSESHLDEVIRTRTALRELSARLVDVQEAERRALSRELHDEVGQSVSALLLAVGNVAASLSPETIHDAKAELRDIRRLAERTVAVVRDMSLLLRPSMLDDLGLIPALEWKAREVSRNDKVHVTITSHILEDELPDDQRTCIYRVVQEALHNVVRHANAKKVDVTVEQDADILQLVIRDDGRGFAPERQKGVGLLGMEERVHHLNGKFKIVSEAGHGTTIRVELPRA